MVIKEIPINYRVYYKTIRNRYIQLKEEAISAKTELIETCKALRNEICDNIQIFKDNFNIDLFQYEEFREDKYICGSFLKIAKGLFINRKNNYEIVSDLFNLYCYAKKQKELYNINKDIELYNKIIALKLNQYKDILKTFYTEVHKKLIIEGCGYAFEGNLGWICINRCHIIKQAPHIDYAATKKRKAELIAQGKRIYNKQEAEWCEKNGITYDGVDGRVYMNNEYCYEIPLLDCRIENGSKYKLYITDYRGRDLRGKTNKELIEECKFDLDKICELSLDVKTKLNLCNEINKMLYLNFIRNENQKPINAAKINRKNR